MYGNTRGTIGSGNLGGFHFSLADDSIIPYYPLFSLPFSTNLLQAA